jgi:glucose dehydrogenase
MRYSPLLLSGIATAAGLIWLSQSSAQSQAQKTPAAAATKDMGTYRMGDDPKTSVVDLFQRSHEHNNLYLVGSGTFPTGGTANPTLTISALAMRTADSIASDLKSQG